MSGNNSKHSKAGHQAGKRRSSWPLAVVAGLFVIGALLTWYGTWFGRTLSDETISEYLAEEQKPRKVQHALYQIAERISKRDPNVKRWYPQIVALAASPVTEIRQTAAWVMGQDNGSEEFHAALVRMLGDSEAIVRRNAAVQLVRFKDPAGLAELRAILQPYAVSAPVAGRVENALPDGTVVKHATLLAKIEKADGKAEELRSPLPGRINRVGAREAAAVNQGETLFSIEPDSEFVWEALRALYVVGEAQDLSEVSRYAEGVERMPDEIKKQAALTAQAIRDRSLKNSLPAANAQ